MTLSPPFFDIEVDRSNGTFHEVDMLGEYISCAPKFHWFLPVQMTIVIKDDHPLVPVFRTCRKQVVGVRTFLRGHPWDGRVMDAVWDWEANKGGIWTLTCIDNRYWAMTVLGWVNPAFPPEVQVGLTGKQDIMFGPLDWVFKWFFARNAIRLNIPVFMQLPVRYSIPQLPTLADLLNLDELLTFLNGIDFIVLSLRFTKLNEAFKQSIETANVGQVCRLVTKGDIERYGSPQVFNTAGLGTLASIMDVTSDYFLDITKLLTMPALVNFEMQDTGYVYHTVDQRDRRWQVWSRDDGSIRRITRRISHATGSSVIVGGQAPQIMNKLVEFAANLAIQAIAAAITTLFGLPGVGAIAVGSLFDDIFFAFQRFDDDDLRTQLGPHGFREDFADNTAAWSLDSFAIGLNKLKKIGGSDTLKLELQGGPGFSHEFGEDQAPGETEDHSAQRYLCGDRITVEDNGTNAEQWISSVEVMDDRSGRLKETPYLGDDTKLTDQWSQLFDRISGLAAFSRAIVVN